MTQMGSIWRDASVLPLMLGAYAVSMLAWAEGLMTRRWHRHCGVQALGGEGWALLTRKLKQTLAARTHEVTDAGGCMTVRHHLVPHLLKQAQ